MIKYKKPKKEYTLDEMIYHLKNPVGKRSLAEMDNVIDEIIQRNPEFVDEIEKILSKGKNERTN